MAKFVPAHDIRSNPVDLASSASNPTSKAIARKRRSTGGFHVLFQHPHKFRRGRQ